MAAKSKLVAAVAWSLLALCVTGFSVDHSGAEAFFGESNSFNTTERLGYYGISPAVQKYARKFLDYYTKHLRDAGLAPYASYDWWVPAPSIAQCELPMTELPFLRVNKISLAAYDSDMPRQSCPAANRIILRPGFRGCYVDRTRFLGKLYNIGLFFSYMGADDKDAFAPVLHAAGYATTRKMCDPRFRRKDMAVVAEGYEALYSLYWPMLLADIKRKFPGVPCDPPSRDHMDKLKVYMKHKRNKAVQAQGSFIRYQKARYLACFEPKKDIDHFKAFMKKNKSRPPSPVAARFGLPMTAKEDSVDAEGENLDEAEDVEDIGASDDFDGSTDSGDAGGESEDPASEDDSVDDMNTEVRLTLRGMQLQTLESKFMTEYTCNKWEASKDYRLVRQTGRLLPNKNVVCCVKTCVEMQTSLRLRQSEIQSCCFGCNKYSCHPFTNGASASKILAGEKENHLKTPVFQFGV